MLNPVVFLGLLIQLCNLCFEQESTNEILHSVFRTDSAEDCWKLAAVKDEVVDVSIEEPDVDVEDKDDIR